MNCYRCKKDFNPDEQEKKFKNATFILTCPSCGFHYELIKHSKGYIKEKNGQLKSPTKKIKMSKKQRLRERKKLKNVDTSAL